MNFVGRILLAILGKGFSVANKWRKKRKSLRKQEIAQLHQAQNAAKIAAKSYEKHGKAALSHAAKLEKLRSDKELSHTKALLKENEKKRDHELKLAKQKVAEVKAGKLLNPARISRYISVARMLSPLVLPLIYRGFMVLREQLKDYRSNTQGIPLAELGRYTKEGTNLISRINAAHKALDSIANSNPGDLQVKKFVTDSLQRLGELSQSVNLAENFPPKRRVQTQKSIDKQLELIESTITQQNGTSIR